MPRVLRRPLAEEDILGIWLFIAGDDEDAADRWLERLEACLHLWASQPLLGRGRDELQPRLRSMAFGRYIVFYELLPDGIDVVRVLHGARDPGPLLESSLP